MLPRNHLDRETGQGSKRPSLMPPFITIYLSKSYNDINCSEAGTHNNKVYGQDGIKRLHTLEFCQILFIDSP